MRRRKTKYIWLPTVGADPNPSGENDLVASNGFSWSCTSTAGITNQPGTIALFPVLEDTPQEQQTTVNPDPTISDFIGNDYVIKRIVGKVTATVGNVGADTFHNFALTVGFFVARADDGTQGGPLVPIGAGNNTTAATNYDPNYVDNIREPWIWRRTWVLSNPSSANADNTEKIFGNYPKATWEYGSIQDGSHIDAKTGRRVRNDERLWFAASLRGISLSGGQYTNAVPAVVGTCSGYLDIRVLGALRKARNRSNF